MAEVHYRIMNYLSNNGVFRTPLATAGLLNSSAGLSSKILQNVLKFINKIYYKFNIKFEALP